MTATTAPAFDGRENLCRSLMGLPQSRVANWRIAEKKETLSDHLYILIQLLPSWGPAYNGRCQTTGEHKTTTTKKMSP